MSRKNWKCNQEFEIDDKPEFPTGHYVVGSHNQRAYFCCYLQHYILSARAESDTVDTHMIDLRGLPCVIKVGSGSSGMREKRSIS